MWRRRRQGWRRLDRAAQLGQAVAQPAGRQHLPADPTITGIDRVSQAQLDRMDSKLLGNAFDLTFAGERHLRVAEAAEGARLELVGVDHGAAAAQMRDPVRPARHQHGKAEHRRTLVGIGAAVEQDARFPREERSVALGAGLHHDTGRMA